MKKKKYQQTNRKEQETWIYRSRTFILLGRKKGYCHILNKVIKTNPNMMQF